MQNWLSRKALNRRLGYILWLKNQPRIVGLYFKVDIEEKYVISHVYVP